MVGGALGFVAMTLLVVSGAVSDVDADLLRRVFLLRDEALTPLVVRISALGNGLTVAVVAIITAALLSVVRLRRAALCMIVTTGGAMLLHTLLKPVFGRPRPEEAEWLITVTALAFPSGHALNATATYLGVALIVTYVDGRSAVARAVAGLMLFIALFVCFSRTYLGVHYPLDVAGGFALGLAWASLCARSLLPRREEAMVDRSAGRR